MNTAQSVQEHLGPLDHEKVALVHTNISQHTCTMFGFGGMDFHGPVVPTGDGVSRAQGPVYSARRGSYKPATVQLAPGATAHIDINYIHNEVMQGEEPTAAKNFWTPATVLVTPPDETTQFTVRWTVGDAVFLYDVGNDEGPSISPVLPGAH